MTKNLDPAEERSRHEREIELHKALSAQYDVRHGFEFTRLYHHHWNSVLMAVAGVRGGAAVDCGCGTGILMEDLSERFEVTGVDISEEMLLHMNPATRTRCVVAVGSLEALPFARGRFDVAFCRGALHHAADLDTALASIAGVLKPGGLLVLSEPCADSWLLRLPRWWWRTRSERFDDDHLALAGRDLREKLAAHGLRVRAERRFGFVAFPLCGLSDILPLMRYLPFRNTLTRWLIGFDEVCAHIPLLKRQAWHIIMVAECE